MQPAPNTYVAQQNRSDFDGAGPRRPVPQNRQLFNPGPPGGGPPNQPTQPNHPHHQTHSQHQFSYAAAVVKQTNYFNWLAPLIIRDANITVHELKEKEHFRVALEKTAQGVIADFAKATIDLIVPQKGIRLSCYGSLANGFAVKDSDMDLLLVIPTETAKKLHDVIPGMQRALEKAFLDSGLGARLLTKTRVPILRVCEKPTTELYAALKEEREKWDREGDEPKKANKINASGDQRTEKSTTAQVDGTGDSAHEGSEASTTQKSKRKRRKWNKIELKDDPKKEGDWSKPEKKAAASTSEPKSSENKTVAESKATTGTPADPGASLALKTSTASTEAVGDAEKPVLTLTTEGTEESVDSKGHKEKIKDKKPLVEEKVSPPSEDVSASRNDPAPPKSPVEVADAPHERRDTSHLEFPKLGIGIQCDVNFSNHIALHNTQLLRCYTICDDRVRDMGLFVKTWAKRRKINSPYHGTLSSYGYVLMVLHYLVNVADPPVLPNLQLAYQDPPPHLAKDELMNFEGCDVRFLRDEKQLDHDRRHGKITRNNHSLGTLLRGFFEYYSSQGPRRNPQFNWMHDVLSLRTPGGIIPKSAKGWTEAKFTESGVRLRFLMAIEDPFELDHNIARTVVHGGIVAIRDEFRRGYKILSRIEDVPGCGWQWRDDDGSIGEDLFTETEDRLDLQKPRFKETQESKDGPKLDGKETKAGAAPTQVPGHANTQENGTGSEQAKTNSAPLSKAKEGKLPVSSNGKQSGEGSKRGQQQKGDANLGTRTQHPNPLPPNQKVKAVEMVRVKDQGMEVTQPAKDKEMVPLDLPKGREGPKVNEPEKVDNTASKVELSRKDLWKERNRRSNEKRKAKAAALREEKLAGKMPATSDKENSNPVTNENATPASRAKPASVTKEPTAVVNPSTSSAECIEGETKGNISGKEASSSTIPAPLNTKPKRSIRDALYLKRPSKKALAKSKSLMPNAGPSTANTPGVSKTGTNGPSPVEALGDVSSTANPTNPQPSKPPPRLSPRTNSLANKEVQQIIRKNGDTQTPISAHGPSHLKPNAPTPSTPSMSKPEKKQPANPTWWKDQNRQKTKQRAAKRAALQAERKNATSNTTASAARPPQASQASSASPPTSLSTSQATPDPSTADVARFPSPLASTSGRSSVSKTPGNFAPVTEAPIITSFESDCLFPNTKTPSLFNRGINEKANVDDVTLGKRAETMEQVLEGLGEVAGYDSEMEEEEVIKDDDSDDDTETDGADEVDGGSGSGSEECPSEC
jgi:Cid1 family poly A polymerase